MSPGPRNTGAPKLGDNPADLCVRVDRLGAIEERLSWLIQSVTGLDRRLVVVEAKGGKARK
jgi:hypothetical protein